METIKHNIKFKNNLSSRKITKYIILHCTATPEERDYTVEQVHSMHLQNGWSGIGYNFVIYRDGTIHEGRPENAVGAHTTNYNSVSIGITYIGGCDSKMNPKDTRTKEQKDSMYKLVDYLTAKYKLTLDDVKMHNQLASKACPSFSKRDFDNEFLDYLETKYEKKCPHCGGKL